MKTYCILSATLTAILLTLAPASTPAQPSAAETSATTIAGSPLRWYNAAQLTVEGRGWPDDQPTSFTRLPERARTFATPAVWNLGRNTAGICVRFVTDSESISARWMGGTPMNHMALTGSHGLDLYRRKGKNDWEFVAVGRPGEKLTTASIAKDLPGRATEYLLYLPLYHSVPELLVGVTDGATIAPAASRARNNAKPIVFYGTSITQGGCASRAGMAHPAILGRWLDREVINLGFSGSGKMEIELAELFGEIDAEVFVLECLPNMTTEMVAERVEPFVKKLREKRPKTPVVLVENPLNPPSHPQNQALQKAFRNLRAAGDKNLTLLEGEPQLRGRENGTVDGVHPTDLGFLRMAEYYRPHLLKLLDRRR